MSPFTPHQAEAIRARGNVLVVAGAGTGKTHTLVERCVTLVLDEGCSLENILMVTFTEAAAAEMRHRIRLALIDRQAQHPENDHLAQQLALLDTAHISTLHSFCLTLVRPHFYELQLDPHLVILDEQQTQPLIQETFDALFESYYTATSPEAEAVRDLIRHHGRGSETRLRELILKVHRYTQTLPNPPGWFEEQLAGFTATEPHQWQAWLVDGFQTWSALWWPVLEPLAGEAENIARCVRVLPRADQECELDQIGPALDEIFAADAADWPKRRKGKLRAPIKNFIIEAAFLHSLVALAGEVDPLAQDWEWVRGPMSALLRLAREFGVRLARAKRELGGVDFADLEQFALRLLREPGGAPTPIARQWQERFHHIFVDEYQDINEAQDSIITALSRENPTANRFLVGDIKQSIYRFRLANPIIFRNYERAWREQPDLGRRIPLADNFRSREAVLAFVNDLFAALMRPSIGGVAYDEDACLRFANSEQRGALRWNSGKIEPSGKSPSGTEQDGQKKPVAPCVELHLIAKELANGNNPESLPEDASAAEAELSDLLTVEREARLVALRLRELMTSQHPVWDADTGTFRPVRWSDMVVLLRSRSNKVEAFAKEFSRLGVPLQAARGGFYDSAEITVSVEPAATARQSVAGHSAPGCAALAIGRALVG